MPSRSTVGNDYRFGFNGQEKDNEVYGEGKSYSAEFWQYDARLGRRWNVDPVIKPWESPYATFGGNPIWFRDVFGADTSFADNQARTDFMTAYNKVNNTVSQLESEIQGYKEQLNTGNLEKKEQKKIEKTISGTQGTLNEWNKLKSDFEKIISSDMIFSYSSDVSGLGDNEYGMFRKNTSEIITTITDADGNVTSITKYVSTINIRPGHDDFVIHEGRHANQLLAGTNNRPVLEVEREAFIYQRIYNPVGIENMIENAKRTEYNDPS
jgi:hypothetical protein